MKKVSKLTDAERRELREQTVVAARARRRGEEIPYKRSGPVSKQIDVGQLFGFLRTERRLSPLNAAERWLCKCECGCNGFRETSGSDLRAGKVFGCKTKRLSPAEKKFRRNNPRPCRECREIRPPSEFTSPTGKECSACRNPPSLRLRQYGLTDADYYRILKEQGGRCAVCRCLPPTTGRTRRLFVDHNHDTGRVRGLLCSPCNGMIGYAREQRRILLAGVEYLDLHEPCLTLVKDVL